MTYANTSERIALISGLRALADYLDSNPEVPTPFHTDVLIFPPDSDWEAMRTEIDVIATRLGAAGRKTAGGHYVASRSFGPIEYRAVAIPRGNDSDDEQSE
jgi:hypothetical protein